MTDNVPLIALLAAYDKQADLSHGVGCLFVWSPRTLSDGHVDVSLGASGEGERVSPGAVGVGSAPASAEGAAVRVGSNRGARGRHAVLAVGLCTARRLRFWGSLGGGGDGAVCTGRMVPRAGRREAGSVLRAVDVRAGQGSPRLGHNA